MLFRIHASRIVLMIALLVLAGCSGKKAPAPPLEEVKLLDRLCNAMQNGRHEEALAIVEKLDAISPDDAVLGEMRIRLISNACVQAAQEALNRNDPEGALRLAEAASRKYPSIPRLKIMVEELHGIIALRDAARRLSAAVTATELASALNAVEPLAAAHPEAKQLAADIKVRRAELAKLRAAEAARAKLAASPAPTEPAPTAKP